VKLKLVVVDLQLSGMARRRLFVAVAAAVALATAGLAFASLPHTFVSGETLTASNLNADLQALDARLSAVEQRQVFVATVASQQAALNQAPTGWVANVSEVDNGSTLELTLNFAQPFSTPPNCLDTQLTFYNGGDAESVFVQTDAIVSVSTTAVTFQTTAVGGSVLDPWFDNIVCYGQ
jgi:hypothetical protein